jgi:hypothetical protein
MTGQQLNPDRDLIEIFVDAIFRHAGTKGYVSLRAFADRSRKPLLLLPVQLDGDIRNTVRSIISTAEIQARRTANHPEPAVFCPPLAVFDSKAGWQAREEDLLEGLVLSVECDEHPEEARRILEEILGPATVVVRSGGQWIDPEDGSAQDKLHLHWRLRIPAEAKDGGLAKLKRARELATRLVGGDSSNIPAVHCLRWPGSWHRKGVARLCEIVSARPDIEIDLDKAFAELKEATPKIAKPNGHHAPDINNTGFVEDDSPIDVDARLAAMRY